VNATPGPAEVERFRLQLERHLGLQLEESQHPFLTELLRRRVHAVSAPMQAYLELLELPALPREELRSLAQELTVSETYFFRNAEQFQALTERVLPELVQTRGPSPQLRLLSAACASGEEPYTLAMILLEQRPLLGVEGRVRAVDINPAILERAARARFGAWSLRETPSQTQARWFRQEGREWVLDPAVRAQVQFEEANLAEEAPGLWLPGHYDVIFCRNVLMYLRPEVARAVVARIARSMVPGGFLFLGHAETLRGLSTDFHLCHTHGTFYYQRRDQPLHPPLPRALPSPGLAASAFPSGDLSWVDVIRQSSERIAQLSARQPPGAGAVVHRPELDRALELLGRDRFEEALTLLQSAPAPDSASTDLLLLRASLLVHSGRLAEAEAVCHQLLRLDELAAGAHYLLALCREAAGETSVAVDHDQTAAYLDPAFAMPRLHLGLMARRRGDLEATRRELSLALLLLQREDAARVLMFGGGFARETLVGLCQAELRRVEESR